MNTFNIIENSNFFDKWKIATQKDLDAPWSGNKNYFRCGLCGKSLCINDAYIVLYTNSNNEAPGNPIVCDLHGKDILDLKLQWLEKCIVWEDIVIKYNWFLRGTRYDKHTKYQDQY